MGSGKVGTLTWDAARVRVTRLLSTAPLDGRLFVAIRCKSMRVEGANRGV